MNSMETAGDSQSSQNLHTALQAIETVLARGEAGTADVSEEFSRAVRALTAFRRHCADRYRAGGAAGSGSASQLERINGLISIMAGIEYPLAGIHWPRVRQVREELRKMAGSPTSGDPSWAQS